METATKSAGIITEQSMEWLDEHLGERGPATRAKPVRIFVTGADEWRDISEWPPPARERVYFLDKEGGLAESAGEGTTTFTFDPSDPTPVLGGRLIHPRHGGVKDNKKLEARPDVVTFTSRPVANDLDIIGRPRVELALSVDNPHADVFVRLCDVDPKGRVAKLRRRAAPSRPQSARQRGAAGHPGARSLRASVDRVVTGCACRCRAEPIPATPAISAPTSLWRAPEKMVPSVHVVHHAGSRIILPISVGSEG